MSRLQSQAIEAMCALLLPLGGGLLLGAGALLYVSHGGTDWWLVAVALAVPLGAWWRRWWEWRYAGVIAALGAGIVDGQPEGWPYLEKQGSDTVHSRDAQQLSQPVLPPQRGTGASARKRS